MNSHGQQPVPIKKSVAVNAALDLDTARTLHIRCGSDIKHTLETAGFTGDFLEFADPFCQGPVPYLPLDEFIQLRANFIASAYGIHPGDALARLTGEYQAIRSLSGYDKAVLWFEHDSYDQLILAFLLDHWSTLSDLPPLELICVDAVPGVPDFTGLGQLSPETLQWLWENQRRSVDSNQIALAKTVWEAYRTPDVEQLFSLWKHGTPAIPPMAGAIGRQLHELPSTFNGLGLTQQLTLEIIAERGPLRAADVFRTLMVEKEPLPYLGDLMFWYILSDMNKARQPLYHRETRSEPIPWPKRVLSITDTGKQVLGGGLDYGLLYPPERWVGGIKIAPETAFPCLDLETATLR